MNTTNSKLKAYVGTYTKGQSKGIYSFTFNTLSGKIDDIKLAAEIGNPTYLNLDKDNKHLYSVAKIGEEGGVAAFSIKESEDKLELLNCETSEGSSPCYVSLDSKDRYVFSANYHKGTVDVLPLKIDKSLDAPSAHMVHEGFGPNKERQEKAHVHYAQLTPDEKYVCTVDLGIDKLVVYKFEEGGLSKFNEVSFKPGCGPRHMDFHPNGKFAYIVTELSSEIITLKYCSETGNFEELDYISMLPENYDGESFGGAIHISPNGKYLYASNRGHDSITIFSVDASSGKLQLVSRTSTQGSYPRDFTIDPTGSYLIAANQNSSNVVSFNIDKATGKLTQTGHSALIPNPVCIKFLK